MTPCSCYSGRPYQDCCGPFLETGGVPETAEALMRSRFSAFQRKNTAYLLSSWDPSTRPPALDFDQDERFWSGLDVVRRIGGGEGDTRGVVEFKASYELGEDTYLFHEISRFVRAGDRWLYLDATFPYHGKIAHQGVPVKNAPCPCGSGKKYKKCCGESTLLASLRRRSGASS